MKRTIFAPLFLSVFDVCNWVYNYISLVLQICENRNPIPSFIILLEVHLVAAIDL